MQISASIYISATLTFRVPAPVRLGGLRMPTSRRPTCKVAIRLTISTRQDTQTQSQSQQLVVVARSHAGLDVGRQPTACDDVDRLKMTCRSWHGDYNGQMKKDDGQRRQSDKLLMENNASLLFCYVLIMQGRTSWSCFGPKRARNKQTNKQATLVWVIYELKSLSGNTKKIM